jgi:hypothetical protein
LKEKEYFKFINKLDNERLRIRIFVDKGKVTDIVVQYESFIGGKWRIIVRYDCSHGFFHRDFLNPNGTKEKKSIGIKNLEDALLYAEQDFKDRWEFYRDKYLKKLKK